MIKIKQKLGLLAISGLKNPKAIADKYKLESPEYIRSRQNPYAFRGSKYIYFATVRDSVLYVPLPVVQNPYSAIESQPVDYPSIRLKLRDYQQEAFDSVAVKSTGLLSAAAGSGKTAIGCQLLYSKKQKSIIIVPTIDLANQWRTRVKEFLGVRAGVIGGGKKTIGEQVTIATFQSALKNKEILRDFGLILIDECHRAPCRSIRDVLSFCPARYRYGCTATPWRSDGLHKALDWLFGAEKFKIDRKEIGQHILPVKIIRIKTDCDTLGRDHNEIQNLIATDYRRNEILVDRIKGLVEEGHTVIALGHRLEQLDEMETILCLRGIDCCAIQSSTKKSLREKQIKEVGKKYKVLVATYQLAAEGLDIPCLSALVMLAPIGNPTKIEQACGRVARVSKGKLPPVVYDFVDNGRMIAALAYKRLQVYKRLGYEVEGK